ncbi:hypothetical protein ACN4EE_06845 [Geminocystis sp. CENA526]|uniref:hypothetical protein n=1 Tax=Geminocystis sp. CENA526 TaxID=1355871 RepID=UPI003D6FD4EC
MKLVFDSTENFEKEIGYFDDNERLLIVNEINNYFSLLLSNPVKFYSKIEQPLQFKLVNNYDSSLYILPINDQLKLIFTVDEDPIFEQIIITLFRLVKNPDSIKVYQETGDLLYHDFLENKKVAVLA